MRREGRMEGGSTGLGDTELVSKNLQVEHKVFYFDLKENPRGRYLKVSEKIAGSRSTIIVPIDGVPWFIDIFTYYVDGDEHEVVSKELQLDSKAFYFDIGVNKRGRFLKISEAPVAHIRSTIIVPAGNSNRDSWAKFRNILVEVNEASQQGSSPSEHVRGLSDGAGYLPGATGEASVLTESDRETPLHMTSGEDIGGEGSVSRFIRADQKKFFLDLGSNSRGQYLRISEVMGGERSTIIVPVTALEQFHDVLGQFIDITRRQGLAGANTGNVQGTSPNR